MRMTNITFVLMAVLGLACGDDTTAGTGGNGGTSASGGSGGSTSATGGSGGSADDCAAECEFTLCNDGTPDTACRGCIETKCGDELDACLADTGGTCGQNPDCTQCGGFVECDECSSQLNLDNEAAVPFNALLNCACYGM
jgi:hypothetical protein